MSKLIDTIEVAKNCIRLARGCAKKGMDGNHGFLVESVDFYELALTENANIIKELVDRLTDLQDKAQELAAEEFIQFLETLSTDS